MKILIVDDDPVGRNVLRQVVEHYGHEVVEAGDGQEGFEKASRHKPDAIISDALMPKRDGFQFLRAIRQDETLYAIPFVFYTGIYTDNKEYALALSLGADALIVKPKAPNDFWKEFTSALDTHASKKKPVPQTRLIEREENYLMDYSRIVAAKLEEKVGDLETVIAKHERTKSILQESEERYRLLFENNPYPMWVYDLETLAFLTVNDAAVYKYGYSREEFFSMTIKDIRPEEDVPALLDKLSKTHDGIDEAGIWRHRKKDGTILDVEITSHILIFSGRRAKLILANDITERRRLEREIRNSSVEWRKTFDAMSDAIFLMDKEGKILRCNRAMAKLLGRQYTDIVGRQCSEIISDASAHIEDWPVALVRKTRKRETWILPLYNRWFEITADPLFDDFGVFTGVVHVMMDITERKQNEDIIRNIALQQTAILNNIPDIAWLKDKESRFIAVNEPFGKACGVKPEDMVGKTDLDIWPKDLAERYRADDREVMESGKQERFEEPLADKTGKTVWIETIKTPIYNEEGEVIGTTGIARDITERNEVRQALKESEEKFRNLFESANDSIFILDMQGNFLDLNKTAYERLGYTKEEMLSKHVSLFDHLEFADKVSERIEQINKYGKAVFESAHLKKDGTVVPIEVNARVIDFKGRKAVFSIIRDITERKLAEQALKESEERYRNLFDSAYVMIQSIAPDGHFVYVNPAWRKTLGYAQKDLQTLTLFDILHESCKPHCINLFSKAMSGEPIEFFGAKFIAKDGRLIDVEGSASVRIVDGKVVDTQGILRDVTERKKLEEQIFLIKQDWEFTFNSITDMVTVHDKDYNIILANKAAHDILGLPFLEKISGSKCFKYYHGTEKAPEGCPSCSCLQTGVAASFEIFEPHLNKFIEIRAIPRFDSNNQLIGLIHVVRDITERKKAEEVLKEEKNKAQNYLDVAGVMIVALDSGGRITLINNKGIEILGYEEHEVINQNWFDLCMPGRIRKEVKDAFNKLIAGDIKPMEYYENPIATKNGAERILAFHNAILRDVSGEISGTLSSGEDITERKKSEEALERYSHELTSLNMASDTLMLITNLKDIYEEICNIIYTVFDLSMVWLGVIGEKNYEVKPVAYVGHEDGYLSAIKVTWDDSPTGMGPTGMAIKGKTIFKENISDTLFAPWKSEAQKRGYVDVMSVPLIYARDKCLGVLTFYSYSPNYFTPDRIQLYQIFSNQAAIAIENVRLIEELEGKVVIRTKELEDANLELQAVNNELGLRREEADAASRSKTDFLANMSHELRTPLNAILGFSGIMREGMAGPVTDKQKEFLTDISSSGAHLLSLITDILDLSKIEAGKLELELGTVSIKEIIASSLIMFKERALKHKIKVTSEIDDTITSITADQRKLKQVIVNLLSNAFKFTSDGGSVQITARKIGGGESLSGTSELPRFRTDEDFVEISVSDTGIGISKEHQQKLFQPFQQIETSLTRKYAGTGLGLSLCRRLIELHGGRIWVESGPGKGSRFTFIIPMEQ